MPTCGKRYLCWFLNALSFSMGWIYIFCKCHGNHDFVSYWHTISFRTCCYIILISTTMFLVISTKYCRSPLTEWTTQSLIALMFARICSSKWCMVYDHATFTMAQKFNRMPQFVYYIVWLELFYFGDLVLSSLVGSVRPSQYYYGEIISNILARFKRCSNSNVDKYSLLQVLECIWNQCTWLLKALVTRLMIMVLLFTIWHRSKSWKFYWQTAID